MKLPIVVTPAQEKEMILLLADGVKGNRIANKLGMTEARLASTLLTLRAKYDCNNSTQLVAYFLRKKLIK